MPKGLKAMAVKITTKEKLQQIKASKKKHLEIVDIVEEMAELKPQCEALKKYSDRYNALREKLLEMIPEDYSDLDPIEFIGDKHKVEFSPRALQRQIADLIKLRNMLGEQTFMAICRVLLADVDKYLSEAEKESIIVATHTGPRKCNVKENLP